MACNCIYAYAKQLDEVLRLSLQESYCFPILTYAVAAIKYTTKQVDDLNACWNSVYRRIFSFSKHESIKCFICGLGRLDLRHIFRIRRVKFFCHMLYSDHRLLNEMFWLNLTNHNDDSELIDCLFKHVNVICSDIYAHFRLISRPN